MLARTTAPLRKQRSSASGRAPSAWRSQSTERRGPAGLRDTHRGMPDESTTPDLVELSRALHEAGDIGDLDAVICFFAPDAARDTSPTAGYRVSQRVHVALHHRCSRTSMFETPLLRAARARPF